MENYISYYELLTMIKDCERVWEYPKVYWHINCTNKVLYIPTFDSVSGDLEGYCLKNRHLENEDIRYWLSECMLESSMFDKCIEIVEEKSECTDKEIETIDLSEWSEITYQEDWDLLTKDFNRNSCLFVNKINKLIDKVKSMEEKINGIVGEEETD